ncbi:MAG: hypothetical protein ACSNEK_02600 [Parachlamydiaceae bacterium]
MQGPQPNIFQGQRIIDRFVSDVEKLKEKKLALEPRKKSIILKILGFFKNQQAERTKLTNEINSFVSKKGVLQKHTEDLLSFLGNENSDFTPEVMSSLKNQHATLSTAYQGLKTLSSNPDELKAFGESVGKLNAAIKDKVGNLVKTPPKPLVAPGANSSPTVQPSNHGEIQVPPRPYPYNGYDNGVATRVPVLPSLDQNQMHAAEQSKANPTPEMSQQNVGAKQSNKVDAKVIAHVTKQLEEIKETEESFLKGIDLSITMFSALKEALGKDLEKASQDEQKVFNDLNEISKDWRVHNRMFRFSSVQKKYRERSKQYEDFRQTREKIERNDKEVEDLSNELRSVQSEVQKFLSQIKSLDREKDPVQRERGLTNLYKSDFFTQYTEAQTKLSPYLSVKKMNEFTNLLKKNFQKEGFRLSNGSKISYEDAWNRGTLAIFAQRLPRHVLFAKDIEKRNPGVLNRVDQQAKSFDRSLPKD